MSEEKPNYTSEEILMAILKETRRQTDMLETIHWVARAQQVGMILALVGIALYLIYFFARAFMS